MPIQRKKPNRNVTFFEREFGCPETRNRSSWCFNVCTPVDGEGPCGRAAPIMIMGRTKRAILNHERRKLETQIQ